MALILAVQPDPEQAARLTNLVRSRLDAELILTETAEHALAAIGSRIPDLVLIPSVLSSHEDAALAGALRVIAATACVQMLTIPLLVDSASAHRAPRVTAKWRRARSVPPSPHGGDPAVFGDQMAAYLAGSAADLEIDRSDTETSASELVMREADKTEADVPSPVVIAERASRRPESSLLPSADEFMTLAVDAFARDVPVETAAEDHSSTAASAHSRADIANLELVQVDATTTAPPLRGAQPPVVTPSTPGERPEWIELIESLRRDVERLRDERAQPLPAAADRVTSPSDRVRRPKARSTEHKPVQDQWGFFDPDQCGFAALLAKLDEISAE